MTEPPTRPSGKVVCSCCLRPIILKGDTACFTGDKPGRYFHVQCAITVAFQAGKKPS